MKRLFVVTFLFFIAGQVQAYSVPTHERISEQVVKKSELWNVSQVGRDLGLLLRISSESEKFPDGKGTDRSILKLVVKGSAFEDDLPRPINHAYDPIDGKGFRWRSLTLGNPSPDWALEDKFEIADPYPGDDEGGFPDADPEQQYSYRDARAYLYQALTDPQESERRRYFGLLFRTLGQVIHHIEDMAQPQHTRSDLHLTWGEKLNRILPNNASRYEAYTGITEITKQLPFKGYDSVVLPTARAHWAWNSGKGLAEYSNRGFVSEGTNFDTGKYASPVFDSKTDVDIRALVPSLPLQPPQENAFEIPGECINDQDPCLLTFFSNYVVDSYRGGKARRMCVHPRTRCSIRI